jgi:hypothetical protein
VPRQQNLNSKSKPAHNREALEACVLPPLATAEQLAKVIQVSSRTIHSWAETGTIPTALRCGKVVRFNPPAVAAALGIQLPEFGIPQLEVTPKTHV